MLHLSPSIASPCGMDVRASPGFTAVSWLVLRVAVLLAGIFAISVWLTRNEISRGETASWQAAQRILTVVTASSLACPSAALQPR